MDGILIEAGLLLDLEKLGVDAYRSIGVDPAKVRQEPFQRWLGRELRVDIEEASELQVARDNRFLQRLFDPRVRELSALDIVHLFVEARQNVYIVSHETPDALDAIIARSGLPNTVAKLALCGRDRRHEIVHEVLSSELAPDWLLVYDRGLAPREEKRVTAELSNRGVLINVTGAVSRTQASDDAILRLIESRWRS